MSFAANKMPCYNASNFLEATLQSSLDKMDERDLLVLVGDHSKDQSPIDVTQFLSQSGINFTTTRNQSKGACAAYNHALFISKNPWTQWPNPDNILGKDKLKEQEFRLAGNPNFISGSPLVPFIGEPIKGAIHEGQDWACPDVLTGADWLASERMTTPASWSGAKRLFTEARLWHTQLPMNHDRENFTRAKAKAESVTFKPNINV